MNMTYKTHPKAVLSPRRSNDCALTITSDERSTLLFDHMPIVFSYAV